MSTAEQGSAGAMESGAQQSSRLGPLVVAVGFAALGLFMSRTLPLMTDHGLLTADCGLQILKNGPAILFFQFMRPTSGLISLPGAWLGWEAFAATHILLGATAVYLMGRTATKLNGSGWQAALILAASPEFLFRTVTGVSNAIAVSLFVVVLYLLIARRSLFWAGLVMGALVWCRYEYGAYGLVMIAFHLRSRDGWKLLAGAGVFPLLYLGSGAIYHESLLWFLRFPPDPGLFPGARELEGIGLTAANAGVVLSGLALICPLWPLVFLRRWSDLSFAEKAVMASLSVAFLALLAIPLTKLLHVPFRTRYWLMFLPNLALLIGGLRLDRLARPRLAVAILGACAVAALLIVLVGNAQWVGALPLFAAMLAMASRWTGPRLRRASFAAFPLLLMLLLLATARHTDLRDNFLSDDTLAVARWLEDIPTESAPEQVLTNVHLLNFALQKDGEYQGPPLRFLLQGDIAFTICRLSNHENGQYSAMAKAFRNDSLLGHSTWSCELPTLSFDDSLFVLRDDYRLQSIISPETWDRMAEPVARFGGIAVWKLRPGSRLEEAQSEFPFQEHCRSICPGEDGRE